MMKHYDRLMPIAAAMENIQELRRIQRRCPAFEVTIVPITYGYYSRIVCTTTEAFEILKSIPGFRVRLEKFAKASLPRNDPNYFRDVTYTYPEYNCGYMNVQYEEFEDL